MEMAPRKIAIFSDFDGTITEHELFVAALKTFAPVLAEQLIPEMYALRLSLREGVRRIVESIPSDRFPAMLDFVARARLRPGFAELLDNTQARGIPFVIISGGLLEFVHQILDTLTQRVTAIYAARVDRSGSRLKLLSDWEEGEELVSKPLILARYPECDAWYVGDSVTDLKIAMQCKTVFARDRLAKYLDERNHPYTPYDDFSTIRRALTAYLDACPTPP